MGRRKRAVIVETEPVDDASPTHSDRAPTWKDPGTYISPERVSACIDRIFGDAPRLTMSVIA